VNPPTNKSYTRLFNPTIYPTTIRDGKYDEDIKNPVDAISLLNSLGS